MNKLLDSVRDAVRAVMLVIARGLNSISGGRITPNAITIIGLLAHVYIAWLIAQQSFIWAAGLLVVFGLFDALDGQLARLQHKASSAGMVLDATTDRMKEVLLYTGASYALIQMGQTSAAVWAVSACGASLLVSYVKAKGETAVKDSTLTPNQVNRLFQDGFLRFELRMTILIIGLLFNYLGASIILIAVLAWYTAFQRLYMIMKKL